MQRTTGLCMIIYSLVFEIGVYVQNIRTMRVQICDHIIFMTANVHAFEHEHLTHHSLHDANMWYAQLRVTGLSIP